MHENLEISANLIPHMNFRLTKKDFYQTFIVFFTIFNTRFLIVVRQEVSNFDSSVELLLELAINRALFVFCTV